MRVHRPFDYGRNRAESEPAVEKRGHGHLVRSVQHHRKRSLGTERPIGKRQTRKSLLIRWVKLEPPCLAQVEGWKRSVPSFWV